MSPIRTGLLSLCLFGEASYTWSFSHLSPSQMKMFRGVPSSLANQHLPQGAPGPSRAVVPSLWDLMPVDLRWSWYSNNRNKVHSKCNVLESSETICTAVCGKIVFQ